MIKITKNEYVHHINRWAIEPERLSDEQKIFLFKLNSQLSGIEEKIKNEVKKLAKIGEEKVSNKNEWTDDYEIECFITFILKEEDKYFSDYNDNVLVQLRECSKYNEWVWGLGDKNNHNEFQHWNHPMNKEHHCWLYHCLYDHTDMGWGNILRIGSIWIDINIEYQKILMVSE